MVLSVILLAASLSVDALVVGMAYGLKKVKIPLVSKLAICFFSIAYSGIAIVTGSSLSSLLPVRVSKLIGIAILAAVGFMIIINAFRGKENKSEREYKFENREKTLVQIAIRSMGITIQVIKNPVEGDIDRSGTIDFRESLLLGLALSVDAIGAGIGSALAGFSSPVIPLSVGLFQLILLYIGTFVGEKFSGRKKLNKRFLSVMPGVLLILLAILRIR
ncbi:MAG: sporulation membrane protein YtaF [Clostridiales bacterium]|jgi:putative sporulation protein YtaF|nr:sporulation membrane protein YtaF [Eubacteriales bacterium]MDH7566449.1 sporulation membrane protein YtaF [Clostridiales bacterium]